MYSSSDPEKIGRELTAPNKTLYFNYDGNMKIEPRMIVLFPVIDSIVFARF